jgi:hypothetical protein
MAGWTILKWQPLKRRKRDNFPPNAAKSAPLNVMAFIARGESNLSNKFLWIANMNSESAETSLYQTFSGIGVTGVCVRTSSARLPQSIARPKAYRVLHIMRSDDSVQEVPKRPDR